MIDKIKTESNEQIIEHWNGRETHYDWLKHELKNDGWHEYYNGYNKNYPTPNGLPDGDIEKIIVSMIKENFKCLINCQGIDIYHFDKLIVKGSFGNYSGILVRHMINDIYTCIYEHTGIKIWLTHES